MGDETTWLPGAAKEAHELHRAGDPGDAEIFVAYRDQPTWERLPQDDYEAEMEREADRAGLT
ncbi:hypothetical protein [Mycobacterium sp. E1747]|uniref:hypothetical protein n=1 Tax=Mycobacterium sp. E1747 TaxID=1834128 RepID=UPI0012E9CB9E|nr:hypothetical protein [Mycobacterium sp. E1747]